MIAMSAMNDVLLHVVLDICPEQGADLLLDFCALRLVRRMHPLGAINTSDSGSSVFTGISLLPVLVRAY